MKKNIFKVQTMTYHISLNFLTSRHSKCDQTKT